MSVVARLNALGQSVWLDSIRRDWLNSGELAGWISQGLVSGITSNPTIFHAAIANSQDYDAGIAALGWAGSDAEGIFWQLAIEDIQQACDLLLPLHKASGAMDGFVSLEEDPALARDSDAAAAQAKSLWARVLRPNLLVKIPATAQSIPAIRRCIAAGLNVNVTLIFSLARYAEVMEAYLAGLEDRLARGLPIDGIASVASFFISRVDSKVDARLGPGSPLRGRLAVANAQLAYDLFLRTFDGARWDRLRDAGGRIQRPLWASTSTKNPSYPDTIYVDRLVGADTINTMPLETLLAVQDHGSAEESITRDLAGARLAVQQLEAGGISFDQITQELEAEGVQAFERSWAALMDVIEARRLASRSQLGRFAEPVGESIARLDGQSVLHRLWQRDPALWSADPVEHSGIVNRLGWLALSTSSGETADAVARFANEVRAEGIRKFLLLGMGGSALAAEAFRDAFSPVGVTFTVLDSTDPDQVRAAAALHPADETLFIVSSKSGTTTEVNALFDYFFEVAGGDGSRFVAITDAGTPLESLARSRHFRAVFLANADVGGRYSAFSHFGLLPAALMGLDVHKLLRSAASMQRQCSPQLPASRNPGLALGALLGIAANRQCEKLVLLADDSLRALAAWIEQLVSESSGKAGKGIVVASARDVSPPPSPVDDRLFAYLRQDGARDDQCASLRAAGYPVLECRIPDVYAVAAEMYRWEFATAIACHLIGVNAFDQPDVQDAKARTQAALREYFLTGRLDRPLRIAANQGIGISTNLDRPHGELQIALEQFLAMAQPSDYVAINAFLPRNSTTSATLDSLQALISRRTGLVTSVGYGPRYLHSTGQLQKGGAENGLFLLLTSRRALDLSLPTQELTFGVLQEAQAIGDYTALQSRGRRCLWLDLPSPAHITSLAETLT